MASQEELVGVREGDVLAGRYRVDRILGVGGMGVVVAAHHIQLDDKVAIKFLLPATLTNKEAVARFAREARVAVKIKSEHVARVSDVGTLENGAPYMVMEFLDGSDLAAWIRDRGPLPVEQAAEFVLQACEALAEAHALGIVHRDLKPANLVVVRRADGVSSVKVLDFGISKITNTTGSGGDSSMTRTSAVMGSPLYMSPEQMQSSRNVDARGDIWALGVILYELVTGEAPFVAETMPELVLQIMSAQPVPLQSRRANLPEGLEAVILRCLEKDRGKRYATVGQLAVELLPFAPKRAKSSVERISGIMQSAGMSASALAVPPSSDSGVEATSKGGTFATWGRTSATPSKGRTPVIVGLLITLALAASGFALLRTPSVPTPDPSAAVVQKPAAPVVEPERSKPDIPVTAEVVASAAPPPLVSAAPEQAAVNPPRPTASPAVRERSSNAAPPRGAKTKPPAPATAATPAAVPVVAPAAPATAPPKKKTNMSSLIDERQ